MWFKERFGAASQNSSHDHEGGPRVGARVGGCHMIQQQLEEDSRRDKSPQQFGSCQALDMGTEREKKESEERHKHIREGKGRQEPQEVLFNLLNIKGLQNPPMNTGASHVIESCLTQSALRTADRLLNC